MSFGKKYFSSYKSNNGLDYYLELFVANFSGTATEIVLGKGGPVITYETDQEDRFSPILSSQCELPFLVQNTLHQDFIEELRTTFQERQIYLHLYRASSSTYSTTKPLWSGFMVMDLGAGEDVSFPYEQKLTFVDGLALLKDIDFVDLSNEDFEDRVMGNYAQENMYFGPAVYTFWIKEILLKAGCATTSQGSTQDYGFTTAINWYNGAMPNTNQNFDPFGNTKCVVSMFHTKNDQQVFTPENCYTVLKELLRHWGARITYWKHEFWIVQIPEYIQDETGFIDNPDNINTRQYNKSGTLLSSQDHLGDTFFTRYEQTVGPDQISKLVGTKYNYLPITHRASADFLSFASKNYYGGFPFGTNATSQEIFQGTIIDPSSANFLFLSIPLNWVWDLSNSNIIEHTGGWWCSIKFNFYATDGTTEYYLQYEQTTGTYYWVLKADWSPIVKSPKYVIKSRRNVETNYIGFQEQIPFVDASGNAITMNGAWSFFLDIEDYATQNGGSFFCRFSGYNNFSGTVIQRNPQVHILLPNPSGSGTTPSGTVSWSNTLQDPSQILVPSTNVPVTFNAGTAQPDIQLVTNSAFMGFLQTLNTTQNASYGNQVVTTINNSNNTELHDFGTLIWGDAVLQATIGALRVNNGSTYIKTNPAGEWGRGTLSGTKTFTELLIDEFLSGQVKVVISPTMRLVVSEALKNQTATGSSGPATRPRFVNPIGRLRETRSNETDPEYIFRRGSFFTLQDEWDYEGYQIIRDTVTATTTTNDLGGLGGSQTDAPLANARMQGPVTNALMQNAPVAYLRKTVASTGSNVSVNGNFNTATGWTLGTGWSIDTTISKAKFTATGSTSDLVQDVLELEKTYKISFRVEVTAGTLTVKAGTSGGSQAITSSGDYIIYKQCLGNTQIKFQAGTTFTGTVTFVRIEEQKSLSQVPIEPLNSAVFKSGDTFNLINSNSGEIMELNVTSNQSAGDTVINVTSTALFDDINIGSIVLINQDDLAAQYQNKTKGTVGGFDITATSIDSGSVAISSYIDDDSFGTASATSLATSESIKAYVDTQVGSADTLQEVTDNGNTTTNSIMIGSSSSPSASLHVVGQYIQLERSGTMGIQFGKSDNLNAGRILYSSSSSDNFMSFYTNDSEKMRLTSDGKLLLNLTSYTGNEDFVINSTTNNGGILLQRSGVDAIKLSRGGTPSFKIYNSSGSQRINFAENLSYIRDSLMIGDNTAPSEKLHVVGDALITGDSHADAFKPAVSGNPIKFKNFGSTEVARITDGGNLLIGTTTDSGFKLDVNGNLRIGDGGTGSSLNFNSTDRGTIKINGDEKARITSGGNFLIGTTTDNGFKLNVSGSITTAGGSANITAPRHMVADSNAIIYRNNDNLTLLTYQNKNITFMPNNSESVRFLASGNVLIGTTNDYDEGKLQVYGDINIINSNGSNPTDAGSLYFGETGGVWGTSLYGFRINLDGSANNLQIQGASTTFIKTIISMQRDTGVVTLGYGLTGTTATFSGQVTIPATPVASTDAASKSYVDAQVGSADTLQEVTDNGNTTTNSIMIGSSTSPSRQLHVHSTSGSAYIQLTQSSTGTTSQDGFQIAMGASQVNLINRENGNIVFETNNAEKMRLTSDGKLLLNTSSSITNELFQVDGSGYFSSHIYVQGGVRLPDSVGSSPALTFNNDTTIGLSRYTTNTILITGDLRAGNVLLTGTLTGTTATFSGNLDVNGNEITVGNNSSIFAENNIRFKSSGAAYIDHNTVSQNIKFRLSNSSSLDVTPFEISPSGVTGTTATFSGQVTIPATPVASTDAASKSYVDAQIGANNDLQEVTDNGATTTNDMTISNGAPEMILKDSTSSSNTVIARNSFRNNVNTEVGTVGFLGDGDLRLTNALSKNITFYTSNAEKMRLTSDGKLGIGVSSPHTLLNLNDNNVAGEAQFGIGDVSSYYLAMGHNSAGNTDGFIGTVYNNDAARFDIRMKGTAQSDSKVTVLGSGNVGINTNSPSEKLHVVGDALITGDSHADAFKPAVSGNPIKFKNFDSSTEFARITNGGNVLIGTTTDGGAKLSVEGGMAVKSGSLISFINTNLTYNSIKRNTSIGGLQIDTGASASMNILDNGNVLIGTTTDSGAKLSVVANTTYQPLLVLRNTGTDASNDIYMGYNRDNSTGSNGWSTGIDSTDNSFNISEDADNINNNVRLKIEAGGTATFSGQVTIPATPVASTDAASKGYVDAQVGSADTLQEVTDNGSTTTNDMTISNGAPSMILKDSTSSSSSMLTRVSYRDNTDTEIGVVGFFSDSNLRLRNFLSSNITFWTSSSEKMRLTSGGNLLIGTTTDSGYKLNVNGTAVITDNLFIDRSSDGSIIFNTSGVNKFLIGYDSSPDGFRIYNYNTSSASLFIEKSTNNLGIGTTSPSYKLDVSSDIRIQGSINMYGFLTNYSGDLKIRNLAASNDTIFQVATSLEAMRIKSNGNLLIGTTTDDGSSKLQVAGNALITGTTFFGDTFTKIQSASGNLLLSNISSSGGINFRTNSVDIAEFTSGGNLLINTTTDVGVPLYVNGVIRAVGGGIQAAQDYGFTLNDESGSNRYGLKFGAAGSVGGSNLLMLTNRSLQSATGGGEVAIGGNESTTGVSEVEIARFQPRVTAASGTQKKVSLDAVLELTAQSTPADPASGKSVIWMDSGGDLKVKINVSGNTVVRTLATYEG